MIKQTNLSFLVPVAFCLTLLFFFVPAYGNGDAETEQKVENQPDLESVIQKVEHRYKSLKDFQAHFIQLARILSYPEDQRSEGKVYLKRDRMMRWDYETPSKDQYFINHDTVIFYSPDIKQARRISLTSHEGIRSPLVFFEGLKTAEPDYILSFNNEPIFDRSTRHILQLTPRNREKTPLLKILLFVDKSDYQVTRVDQYDLYGNVTELYFQDVKTNQKLPDSHFSFVPPKGVEVIVQP
jgi:outer membrane lipoprotein carrier protein